MSRLPRPHSSPPSKSSENYIPAMTLKRKAAQDQDDELEATDQPRKLPAIGNARPLREIRTRTNSVSKLGVGPPPLTKPRAPAAARPTLSSRVSRATSAPPKSTATIPRSVSGTVTLTRPGARVASGSRAPPGPGDDHRFTALQHQVSSIESARAADAAALAASMEAERTKVAELQTNHMALSRELASAKSHELNQRRELVVASDEIEGLRKRYQREVTDLEMDLKKREREARELSEEVRMMRGDVERERDMVSALKTTLSQQATAHLTLTTQNSMLQAQISALQGSLDTGSSSISTLRLEMETAERRIAELEAEAREAEGVRRKLHNMVQELKGNIRVFCRVRPVLPSDEEDGTQADMAFPDRRDHKEIVLSASSESAMGQERKEVYNFGFDRVFEPHSTQADVFEEISQLAHSCTDGYNVCIFAYGQTGSGKSFTMEGGNTESSMGMIPRAVEQVFRVAEELKSKGWEYTMEGQFLEIYNETINDLLGKHEFDKKKHEIKHDPKTLRTSVTDATVLPLSSPAHVRALLSLAQGRRSVAATLMNERSSRSHSVFTLRITGANRETGERCAGSLNLVDLAGSERLEKSGAGSDKDRLRETQNINKSLSALGDVIAALGEKGEKGEKHIPYRNSKLTYLLQNSLSGNSKTLMVLNLSPLAAHLNESLTSLRFATKVNTTTIGTAKKARLASS